MHYHQILSSGEEESRNLDEYLDDSEAENEKMSNTRKSKNIVEKILKTWLPEAGVKVAKGRKTFLQRVSDDSKAENEKSKK